MTFTRAIYASTLAAGIGLAGLVGVGVGTASADPWGRLVTRPARSDATTTATIGTAIAAVRIRWTGNPGASTRVAVITRRSIGMASR